MKKENPSDTLKNLKQNWEDLAQIDPLFAVYSIPEKKFGKWGLEEFFLTGEQNFKRIMEITSKLDYDKKNDCALDFGCGVGRFTRPLAFRFKTYYGVDISDTMIKKAKSYHKDLSNCNFLVNDKENLECFPDNFFDFIFSNLVLQHIPDQSLIRSYILEFIRVLKKGGILIFQLLNYIHLVTKNMKYPKFSKLRDKGHDPKDLYEKQNMTPIIMNYIPENEISEFLIENNAKILLINKEIKGKNQDMESRTYFVTK
jgi:ubiquinone/menaquinone biosynthesis C-methylase UbiE